MNSWFLSKTAKHFFPNLVIMNSLQFEYHEVINYELLLSKILIYLNKYRISIIYLILKMIVFFH